MTDCVIKKYDMIYSLTAIVLIPGGRSTVHIYTKQYTGHNETEYTKQNIYKNKNT
jgi:hypothetical protein